MPDDMRHGERRFAGERGGVPVTRLGMYDIVLWLRLTGALHEAIDAGRSLVVGYRHRLAAETPQ